MALDHRDSAAEELRRIEDYRKSFRQSTRFDDRFACRMLAGTYLLGFGGQYLAMILFPSFADKSGTVLMTVGSARAYGMPPSVNAPAASAARMRGVRDLDLWV